MQGREGRFYPSLNCLEKEEITFSQLRKLNASIQKCPLRLISHSRCVTKLTLIPDLWKQYIIPNYSNGSAVISVAIWLDKNGFKVRRLFNLGEEALCVWSENRY